MTLTDKILSLPTTNAGDSVPLNLVVEAVKDAVVVELDPKYHPHDPEDATEALVWAALDTAWNILGEAAVKSILLQIREQSAELGFEMPPDDEIFRLASEDGDPDAPTCYRDLIPESVVAANLIGRAFQILVDLAGNGAAEGFGNDGA